MARPRNPTSDKDQFVSPSPLSVFMADDVVQSVLDHETIEYNTKRAGYISYFSKPQDEDRLEYLINARWPLGALNISKWNKILSVYYPPHPLLKGETHHSPTDDAKVKAHCLKHALTRLFELVDVPKIIVSDLMILLDGYGIKELKAYSRAQHELLVDETTTYREIAGKAGIDQSEISQAVKSGHLIDPWHEGRG